MKGWGGERGGGRETARTHLVRVPDRSVANKSSDVPAMSEANREKGLARSATTSRRWLVVQMCGILLLLSFAAAVLRSSPPLTSA